MPDCGDDNVCASSGDGYYLGRKACKSGKVQLKSVYDRWIIVCFFATRFVYVELNVCFCGAPVVVNVAQAR